MDLKDLYFSGLPKPTFTEALYQNPFKTPSFTTMHKGIHLLFKFAHGYSISHYIFYYT